LQAPGDRIIYIAADDVTIDGLEIANGTGDLVRQSDAYSGTIIRNCIVRHSSGDEGIQLKASTDCLVESNLVYDVAHDGISIAEGSHNSVISKNEIDNVGSENAAIYVYDSYDMTLECNYIHDTQAANGIKMYKNCSGRPRNQVSQGPSARNPCFLDVPAGAEHTY
jgi:parallel beta-helix repeat protein